MDNTTEKSCLEEISHHVCDENRKVNIAEISNNWSVSYKESESILKKWLSHYKGARNALKEYLIRGVDLNGSCVITVVPERKMDALEQMCPKYSSSLYSIELESGSGKSSNMTHPTKTKFVALKLDSSERKCNVASLPVSPLKPTRTEPSSSKPSTSKGASALFGASAVKKEVVNNSSTAAVKVEKPSPSKSKSPKKFSPKSESPKKKTVKPPASKSISSFFSAKPGVSKPVPEATTTPERIEPKVELPEVKTEVVEKNTPTESKKRVLSQSDDDCIPGTPPVNKAPATKKLKKNLAKAKNEKTAANRSRILQICDSSSDEDVAAPTQSTSDKAETVVKKEKENTTPTKNDDSEKMDVEDEGCSNENGTEKPKRRRKVKKTVKKTFEDKDGYINTMLVTEEVSCSEEEDNAVSQKSQKIVKVEPAVQEKKKVSPPNGKKQGSILSFFAKK